MGGHASLTGAPSTLLSCEESGIAAGAAGFPWAQGELGGASHEPLQWTLQGVLGEEVQAGLYLPCHDLPCWSVAASLGWISEWLRALLPWLGCAGSACEAWI